jgi:pantoate kinase
MNMKAAAFSPGHITGFFAIKDTPSSPMEKGSLGAGVSLTHGVTTTLRLEKEREDRVVIRFNKKEVINAPVSERVVRLFFEKTGSNLRGKLIIDHDITVPMGSGFGSSGSGALGLAYALNGLFAGGLSSLDAAMIAHQAEVEMKTGLGTVIGETFGGIEIRTKPGGPGIGAIIHIPVPSPHIIVALIFGPLSTKEYLSDAGARERINACGSLLIDKIINEPTIHNFLTFSREFTLETGLVTEECRNLIDRCGKKGFILGMPIFGNGVFTIVEKGREDELVKMLHPYSNRARLMVSSIDFEGARTIDKI